MQVIYDILINSFTNQFIFHQCLGFFRQTVESISECIKKESGNVSRNIAFKLHNNVTCSSICGQIRSTTATVSPLKYCT